MSALEGFTILKPLNYLITQLYPVKLNKLNYFSGFPVTNSPYLISHFIISSLDFLKFILKLVLI